VKDAPGSSYDLDTRAIEDAFAKACNTMDGWNLMDHSGNYIIYERSPTDFPFWESENFPSRIPIAKIHVSWPDLSAELLFNTLMDDEYRGVWDTKMKKGGLVCRLDDRNYITYYSVQGPFGIKSRDWVLQRTSQVKSNEEFIILSRSVCHSDYPETSEFVRANSVLTGFYIRDLKEKGCSVTYITQTDPKGSVPSWAYRWASRIYAPYMMTTFYQACQNYKSWKQQTQPRDNLTFGYNQKKDIPT